MNSNRNQWTGHDVGSGVLILVTDCMARSKESVSLIDIHEFAKIVESDTQGLLIIDCRSFLEYNTSHVQKAVSINTSKLVKRRLQQNKVMSLQSLCNSLSLFSQSVSASLFLRNSGLTHSLLLSFSLSCLPLLLLLCFASCCETIRFRFRNCCRTRAEQGSACQQ